MMDLRTSPEIIQHPKLLSSPAPITVPGPTLNEKFLINTDSGQSARTPASLISINSNLELCTPPDLSSHKLSGELFTEKITPVSFRFAKLDKVLPLFGKTSLPVGEWGLLRLITNPATSATEVADLRATIAELKKGSELRSAVDDLLGDLAEDRPSTLTGWEETLNIFGSKSITSSKSRSLKQIILGAIRETWRVLPVVGFGRKTATRALKAIASLPSDDESPWNKIKDRAESVLNDPSIGLLSGRIYLTKDGIKTAEEVSFFTPRLPLNLGGLNYMYLGLLAAPFIFGAIASQLMPLVLPLIQLATSIRSRSITAFSHRLATSPANEVIDLVAKLDALRTLADFDERTEKLGWKHATIIDNSPFYFSAEGLRNPVLALQSKDLSSCLPNNVEILSGKPLCITGPNSGGKTTFALTIYLSQLLTQLGLRIPSDRATTSVADRLLYQGPSFNGLDSEGRFGTELEITKDLMTEATDQSLIILDELAGGTSSKEQFQIGEKVMQGFARIGSGVALITHDHPLAEHLAQSQVITPIQMGLNGDTPTFIAEPGVATTSHAMKVAARVGLTPDDIDRIVQSKVRHTSTQEAQRMKFNEH